jgi:membrane-associated phospholipid phosphatase
VAYLKQKGYELHERRTRTPIYLVGSVSVWLCFLVLTVLKAPLVLIAGLAAISVWLPLQLIVNSYVTKVSSHAAVVAGCALGLLLLGKLDNLWLLSLVSLIVFTTVWARVVTKNHTILQVVVGLLTGSIPILIVFPMMLR